MVGGSQSINTTECFLFGNIKLKCMFYFMPLLRDLTNLSVAVHGNSVTQRDGVTEKGHIKSHTFAGLDLTLLSVTVKMEIIH